jgi:PST family polysaccharide transporter
VLIGLVRTKVAALILGPAGVGMIGLMRNLITAGATVSSLGFGTAGTRHIADASSNGTGAAVADAWRALWWGTCIVALAGTVGVCVSSGWLARYVLGDPHAGRQVAWLSLGVLLTVLAGAQTAFLNGLRRVGDIAGIAVLAAIAGTIVSVGALLLWGSDGVVLFVLAAPLTTFVIGHLYMARLSAARGAGGTSLMSLMPQWRALAKVGVGVTLAALVQAIGTLVIRALIQNQLGTTALGEFQAAWSISMTYVGYVLAAMATDYYPRLSAAVRDRSTAKRVLNEQTEVALLLAGPLFVAMLGFAPWVIELLYSSRFTAAVSIIRWQVLGDVLKVASFPLAYSLLASGSGGTYMLAELVFTGILVAAVWIGIPYLGIGSTGVAFLIAYAGYLVAVYGLAHRQVGVGWTRRVWALTGVVCLCAGTVHFLAGLGLAISASAGCLFGALLGGYSVRRLSILAASGASPSGRLGVLMGRLRLGYYRAR